MKLPHTEVKFYPEVKSQTGLSSLRVLCKRALTVIIHLNRKFLFMFNHVMRDVEKWPNVL